MASNGLKIMKEKFKEGTGEQLWTPKVIRKMDTEGNINADSHVNGQHRH